MPDDYRRRKMIAELESKLALAVKEYGDPIPLYIVRAAINIPSGFPGEDLPVSPELPPPNEVFFSKLASLFRSIFITLARDNIDPTKQEMDSAIPFLRPGLVDDTQR